MASPSKAWPLTMLLLRLFTFIFLVVSLVVLATDSFSFPNLFSSSGKSTFRFNEVYAYRYVVSVTAIGCAYTLVWIPFAAYYASNGKPVSVGLPPLNLHLDVVMALVLATGIGAGFGLTVDAKRFFDDPDSGLVADDDILSKLDKFFDMAYISASFLLAGTVAMAALIIVSSLALAKK